MSGNTNIATLRLRYTVGKTMRSHLLAKWPSLPNLIFFTYKIISHRIGWNITKYSLAHKRARYYPNVNHEYRSVAGCWKDWDGVTTNILTDNREMTQGRSNGSFTRSSWITSSFRLDTGKVCVCCSNNRFSILVGKWIIFYNLNSFGHLQPAHGRRTCAMGHWAKLTRLLTMGTLICHSLFLLSFIIHWKRPTGLNSVCFQQTQHLPGEQNSTDPLATCSVAERTSYG